MKINSSKFVLNLLSFLFFLFISCSSDKDGLNEDANKVNCIVNFSYVDNFTGSSRNHAPTNSCSLWIFDESGKLVESYSELSEKVASLDYAINLSLPPGRYDFVAWFGIEGNSFVRIADNPPASIEDLSLSLQLDSNVGEGSETFSSDIPVIYNGNISGMEIKKTQSANFPRKITMNLIRDSKVVEISLIGKENDDIKNGKLNFMITNGNNLITWDNSVKATNSFCYRPFKEIMTDEYEGYSSLKARFSTFPLTIESNHRLIVTRKSDNKEIINMPIVEELLKEKPMKFPEGSEEEYMARTDLFYLSIYLGEDEGKKQ